MEKTKVKFSIFNFQFSITKKITSWVRRNRAEAIILAMILLVGAFFRLYRIDEYMTFLGDEGRDVIVVRRLLVHGDPVLIGPGTSIGNMYLGPLYYYMMAPALLLANFSPVGPAVMIALLGVATVFLVWWVGREWFPPRRQPARRQGRGFAGQASVAGLVAAGLYAIAPTVIIYSRSSWNPNIMPLFALLCIYSLWRVWSPFDFKWLIVLGISYAFVLQSHYLGLLLVPTLGFFWLLTFLKIRQSSIDDRQQKFKNFFRFTIYGLLIFSFLMSPLVIFDARHGWRNFAAAETFFTQRQTTVSAKPWNAIPKLWPIVNKVSTRLVSASSAELGKWVSIGIAGALAWTAIFYRKRLNTTKRSAYLIIGVWLFFALIGLGVYKQEIYDHYFGFFFTAPFILIGGAVQGIVHSAKNKGGLSKLVTYSLLFVTFIILVFVNLKNNPLKYSPNRQLQRTMLIAKKVIEVSGGAPFNFAVIAERNYEGAYLYFMEMWEAPAVVPIADKLDETLKNQLLVVCEVPREKCTPETNKRPEITNFGWLEKVADWEYEGVIILKYIHPS